jgi:hypothetical protein
MEKICLELKPVDLIGVPFEYVSTKSRRFIPAVGLDALRIFQFPRCWNYAIGSAAFARIIAAALGAIVASGAFCRSIVDPSGQSVSSDPRPVLLAQTSRNEHRPLTWFLDEPPSDLSQSTLPPSAGEIVVAKVRLPGRSAYLVGRDQSGLPSEKKPPEELFFAWLELLDVVRGKRPAERFLDATFGLADNSHTYIQHPATPQQLVRDYFVAIYEEGGRLHLAGFPNSEASYREWEKEFLEYERTRLMSPGKQ